MECPHPTSLEMGQSSTCRPDHEVHARGTIPDVVFIIECRFIRTDLTSGTSRVWSRVNARVSTSRRRNRTSIGRSTPCRRWASTRPGSIWTKVRLHSGTPRPAGGHRVRPGRRRDRRAHPGQVGPHRPGHPEPDPRTGRTGSRRPEPRRPDQGGLREPSRSDGPARRSSISPICANGADLHARTGRARQSRGDREGQARRPPFRGQPEPAGLRPPYGTKGRPSRRS